MPNSNPWHIWVDTGGTFTDCLAVAPDGGMRRAKVLSTSALRGRVVAVAGPDRLRVELAYRLPDGFFRGFELVVLDGSGSRAPVLGSGSDGELWLGAGLPTLPPIGQAVELLGREEAPVLAARVVTATPAGEALPSLQMRLATTRGTNALLERRGARTALFVTRGFGDLLAIGNQQRPDLFALAVVKPEPLPEVVVEVSERLAADGSVLEPPDLAAVEEAAREVVARGIRSAAVALLHSYRNPGHEQAVAACLRRCGFTTVSASAELAPVIKLLPRAQTAVVDAYLAPVVGSYLEGVQRELGGHRLHVMTSAGGLVGAARFRAKDSLLSGPAGGVVGAASVGRALGLRRLIAFDMGGTSTDVSRYDGELEWVFEHEVGDVRLAAPALAVETVAAGGGSICGYDGHQLKVGPQSAGARPGPACYGVGGPLALTDVNLLLGRLDPRQFEIPLDLDAARAAAEALAREVGETSGDPARRDALLAGLLAIADERMAEAIRAISLARGYDPRDYALVSFGGAGGQHACAVAGLLGIATVVVPPDAGLLSAAGLGAAVIERFAERQVLEPLAQMEGGLPALLSELGAAAVRRVEEEGIPAGEVEIRRSLVLLRLLGQETAIPLAWRPGLGLGAAFEEEYRRLYGYLPPGRPIEVESLRVVASSRAPAFAPQAPPEAPHRAAGVARKAMHFGDTWHEAELFQRDDLAPGAGLAGPALVLERHATTVVPPGWQGKVEAGGALLLTRGERPS